MNRTLRYLFSLMGFFLMWGVFGLIAAAPRGDTHAQVAMPALQESATVTEAADSVGIPVTGEPKPLLTEVIVFYGLIGLTAMFLILAMLNVVNKSTASYVQRKESSSRKTDLD